MRFVTVGDIEHTGFGNTKVSLTYSAMIILVSTIHLQSNEKGDGSKHLPIITDHICDCKD